MSITGTYRHYVRTGGRSRAAYSEKHITNASIYGTRPIVPPEVLRERDARLEADNRSDIEKWLGNPPPGRSALAQYQRRQAEREAAERFRPSISACPVSRSIQNAHSAQAAADCRSIARARKPEPAPEQTNGHAIIKPPSPTPESAPLPQPCKPPPLLARSLVDHAAITTSLRTASKQDARLAARCTAMPRRVAVTRPVPMSAPGQSRHKPEEGGFSC
jgi:hypothetical protein